MPTRRVNESANGNAYVTLPLLYEKLEAITAQNRAEHQEIRLEITRGLASMVDTQHSFGERLIRIESTPAHEKFQQQFCPNTKDIEDTKVWQDKQEAIQKDIFTKIGECEKKIDKFIGVIVEERKSFDAERMSRDLRDMKRSRNTLIGIIVSAVVTFISAIITKSVGMW